MGGAAVALRSADEPADRRRVAASWRLVRVSLKPAVDLTFSSMKEEDGDFCTFFVNAKIVLRVKALFMN